MWLFHAHNTAKCGSKTGPRSSHMKAKADPLLGWRRLSKTVRTHKHRQKQIQDLVEGPSLSNTHRQVIVVYGEEVTIPQMCSFDGGGDGLSTFFRKVTSISG